MSSNLGSMVLELSANVARFQSDMGKMYQSAQETADKITSAFERVGAVLGVGFGVDAFKEFVGGAIEAQDQALKFAQKVGISTDAVAGLSSAAKKAGVDQQELQQALTKLAVSASEAGNGVKKYAEAYSALGINVKDASGNIKSADVLFGELADKFASYKDSTTKTADAVYLLGKSGANLIPLLNGGSDAMQRQIKLAKDLGAAIGTDAAKGAEEFKGKMHDLELVSQGLGNQIASALLPALNKFADAAVKFFTSDTWKSWLASVTSGFTAVANHIGDIVSGVKLLGEIALDYIGVRLVGSLVTATARMLALATATMAANSAAAEIGLSFDTGVAASIKSIGLLNAALGSVFAAVSGWQIGTYLYDQFSVVRTIAQNFIATFDALWTVIRAGAQGAWLYIEKSFYTMLDAVSGHLSDSLAGMAASFAKLPDALGGSKLSAQFLALSAAIAPSGQGVSDLDAKIAELQADTSKSLKIIATSWDDGTQATKAAAVATDSVGDAAKRAAPNISGLSDGLKNAADEARALVEAAKAMDTLQKIVTSLSGKAGDPFDAATARYANDLLALKDAAEAAAIAGGDVSKIIPLWQKGEENAAAALAKTNAEITAQSDLLGKFQREIADQTSFIGLTDRALAVAEAVAKVTDEYKQNVEAGKPVKQSLEDLQNGAAAAAGKFYDLKTAADLNKEAAKGWQSIWSQAGNSVADTFAKVLVHGGSLFKGLRDLAQQTVEQIIAYFAKLAIINPILNAIFGGSVGFSMMPTLANAFGGGGGGIVGISGGGAGVAGLVSNFSGGASAGSIFSPSTWIDAGKNIYSGFTSLFSGGTAAGAMSGGGGTLLDYGMSGGNSTLLNYGAGGAINPGAIGYGGYGSALGQGLGVAGGIYAGYNEYQNAGGGVAGLAGGAAYGVGTYLVGAGVSAAMAGGMSAGIAAMGALGPIGWVAIAAMVVNMVSGGKLFGTSGKPIGGQLTETIGAGGATLAESMTYKGQHALFGGSYYHDKTIPVDPAAQKAADDFFAALTKGTADFAKQFGAAAADIVGGTFVQHFDKKGNPTTTDDTVLGVTYHEDQQHFAERLQADNYLAVLDKMGIGASAFVAGLQSDADKLMAGVQDLAQAAQIAQADITKGIGLLGKDGGIAAVMAEVIKLNDGNEKLADEYVRLQQETIGLQAILDTTGLSIGKTGTDFVEFADAAAKAAGGIQNLTQLANQFAKDFYSASELTATGIANLKTKVAGEFATLGEDPTESLAKFRQDFEAALPTMSPEDLAKWYQAGVDLASLNQAVQSAAQNYAQFIAQFNAPSGLTQFEQAMVNLGDSITANVKKANDLAIANGLAGASAADIGKIIAASVAQGAQMLQALQQEAAQLSGQLFGTSLDQLKQQLSDAQARLDHASQTGQYDLRDQALSKSLSAQIAQSDAQAKAQQQFAQAASLLGDLGQIGAVTGQSLQDFAKQFGIPLDKFASMLGTDAAGLNKDFGQQEAMAKAALNTEQNTKYTNELLADILAASRNQPLPFDTNTLIADSSNPSGKSSGHGYAPPGGGSTQPASRQEVSSPKVEKLLGDLIGEIQSARREGVISNRNTAGDAVKTILLASINQTLVLFGTPTTVVLGNAYSYTFEALFGSGVYTLTESGSLPTGLSFADNGDGTATISGTTSVPGDFPFTITVQDSDRNRISKDFTLSVQPLPLTLTGSFPGGIESTTASGSLSASGGVSPYTYALTSGPCAINTSTGAATGNWFAPATYNWTGTVTDSLGATANCSGTTTNLYTLLTITGSFTNIYDKGDAGSGAGSVTIAGGNGVYSNPRLASGSLPTGLSIAISGSTLVLTGTTTAYGTFTFVPRVDSGDGQTADGASQTIIVGNPHFSSVVSQQDWSGTLSGSLIDDLVAAHSDFFWQVLNGANIVSGGGPFGDNAVAIASSGSAQYVQISNSSATLAMGTGDYMIESWVDFTTLADTVYRCCFDLRPGANGLYPGYYVNTSLGSNQVDNFFNSADNLYTPSPAPTTATWYHIAVARISGVRYVLFHGQVLGSVADTGNYPASQVTIGVNPFNVGVNSLNGRTAQWRATKGYGSYYGNLSGSTYTVPARAFQKGGV
jgi:hypothetical protein